MRFGFLVHHVLAIHPLAVSRTDQKELMATSDKDRNAACYFGFVIALAMGICAVLYWDAPACGCNPCECDPCACEASE